MSDTDLRGRNEMVIKHNFLLLPLEQLDVRTILADAGKAKNEIDILERAKILKQAEVLLMNDMPLAPILFGISRHLVQEDIEGWVENPSSFHASRYLRRR